MKFKGRSKLLAKLDPKKLEQQLKDLQEKAETLDPDDDTEEAWELRDAYESAESFFDDDDFEQTAAQIKRANSAVKKLKSEYNW